MTKTKPKSDSKKVEEWLDQLDPSQVPARDGTHSRRIIEACHGLEHADAELRRVVAEARAGSAPLGGGL